MWSYCVVINTSHLQNIRRISWLVSILRLVSFLLSHRNAKTEWSMPTRLGFPSENEFSLIFGHVICRFCYYFTHKITTLVSDIISQDFHKDPIVDLYLLVLLVNFIGRQMNGETNLNNQLLIVIQRDFSETYSMVLSRKHRIQQLG